MAIIRVSGPAALTSLRALAAQPETFLPQAGKMLRLQLFEPSGLPQAAARGRPIDDCLAVCFYGPRSYTGEDVVEYHVHGGSLTVQLTLEALVQLGLRAALPGEFSFRAVRSGKMTVFQAQAVADLIAAKNQDAALLALAKMSPAQTSFLQNLALQLRKLAALAEVGIDFSDQNLPEVSLPRLQSKLQPLSQTLGHLGASLDRGQKLQEGLQVVLVGLPNSGKSSLFNALLGEDRSIVTPEAGTTRDVIQQSVQLLSTPQAGRVTLQLLDTAGLRETDHRIEHLGIERALAAVAKADGLLLVIDPAGCERQWEDLSAMLPAAGGPSGVGETGESASAPAQASRFVIGVITKADLYDDPRLQQATARLQQLAQRWGEGGGGVGWVGQGLSAPWVVTSAQTHAGIKELCARIAEACLGQAPGSADELLLTRVQHQVAIHQAIADLERAGHAEDLEFFASDIRQALAHLSLFIGETLTDDILTAIFSEFCIGK